MIDKEYIKINIFEKIKYSFWIICFFICMMNSLVYIIFYCNRAIECSNEKLYFFEYLVTFFLSENRLCIFYPIIVILIAYMIYKNDTFNTILVIKNNSRKSYFVNTVVSAMIVSVILLFLSCLGLFLNSILLNMDYSLRIDIPIMEYFELYTSKCNNISILLVVTLLGYFCYLVCIMMMFFTLNIIIKNNTYTVCISLLIIGFIYEMIKQRIFTGVSRYILIASNIIDFNCGFNRLWYIKNIIYWVCVMVIITYFSYKIVMRYDLEIGKKIYDK